MRGGVWMWLVGLASAVVAVGGCDRSEARGGKAEAKAAAGEVRLVVLSPALAETLRELGQGEKIVGRHGWDSFTPREVPAVGNEHGLDYEGILKVRPTHVVVQAGARDTPARLAELATQEGWTITRVALLTLDDVAASVGVLGGVSGAEASRVAAVEQSFRGAFERRAELVGTDAGRVLVLAGVDPPSVMGPGSFHFEMVERLGGDAIPDEGTPYIQWSVEDVIKADPDVLVLMLPGGEKQSASAEPSANLGPLARAGLRCVENGAVVVVTDTKGHLPAVSLGAIAKQVGDGLVRVRGGVPRRNPRKAAPGNVGVPKRRRSRVRTTA
ncbi:MAG: ABC transporter substrate-binding protein [Phycisphaerales bacterium]